VSTLLPGNFVEIVERLAVGLEPRDAISGTRIARPVDITLDRAPDFRPDAPSWPEQSPVEGLRPLRRHGSGRYVLVFGRGVEAPVKLRLVPRDRRYVPRRLEVNIIDEAAVLAAEQTATDVPTTSRTWQPLLFPGAGYDVSSGATGVRGRITSGGAPVRWTRAEASVSGRVIGRAHGDDRGEFLLVLGENVGATGDLISPLAVTIRIFARNPALAVDRADLLADLEPETVAAPGALNDPVAAGTTLPNNYAQVAQLVAHPLALGRLSSVSIAV
jgi:hypothetical protein